MFTREEHKNPLHDLLPPMVVLSHASGKLRFTSSGKGFTLEDRYLSAYGETLERKTMYSIKADMFCSFTNKNKKFISPHLFHPEFETLQNSKIEWIRVRQSGASKSDYLHRPIRNSRKPKLFSHTSNGCAVGLSKKDAMLRAKREILERHTFLSHWYFRNAKVTCLLGEIKFETQLENSGWSVFRFHVGSSGNAGACCVLLINRRDQRFQIGGGIVGLSYGRSKRSQESALAECVQALEIHLAGGKREPSIDFYLSRPDGGMILLDMLTAHRRTNRALCLGPEFFLIRKTGEELPYYAEAFIANALPIQLGRFKTLRVPKDSGM